MQSLYGHKEPIEVCEGLAWRSGLPFSHSKEKKNIYG